MTRQSSLPRRAIACSAGKIFLYARSPLAPKKTRASDRGFSIRLLLLDVSAEAKAHGGEHLVLEEVEVPRREALEERGGQDERRHSLIIRRRDGPATLARVRDAAPELV